MNVFSLFELYNHFWWKRFKTIRKIGPNGELLEAGASWQEHPGPVLGALVFAVGVVLVLVAFASLMAGWTIAVFVFLFLGIYFFYISREGFQLRTLVFTPDGAIRMPRGHRKRPSLRKYKADIFALRSIELSGHYEGYYAVDLHFENGDTNFMTYRQYSAHGRKIVVQLTQARDEMRAQIIRNRSESTSHGHEGERARFN